MERLEKIDIDNIIGDLMKSHSPVKEALAFNKKFDGRALHLVFRDAMESGNVVVANVIYKTIILEKLHRINYFIGLCREGNYSQYLDSLSSVEKQDLMDDFIFRLELQQGSLDDGEAFEILMASMEESKKI